jgi:glycosyltransferase involved in cell wall biosynthesis
MKKITVMHLVKTLGLGGAELNLYNLVRHIEPRRFNVHVGYTSGGPFEQRFRESGIPLFKYSQFDHRLRSAATIGIVRRLVAYMRKHNVDIVQTHSFNAHVWGGIASMLTGARLIEHVHDFRYLPPDEYRRRRGEVTQYSYARFMKGISDRVVVLTGQNRDYLINQGLYAGSVIRRIQNGVPLSSSSQSDRQRIRRIKSSFGIDADSRVIFTPCRFVPEKNVDLILRIAGKVVTRNPSTVFVVCGDGPLIDEFRREVAVRGLDKSVLTPGYIPHVQNTLSIADIFLLPSFLELHSIAMIEALSMKVPVVVSRGVGCNDEFIDDGDNGFLLDPFCDEGWADCLICLLSDERLRRSVAEKGYDLCRRYFNIVNTATQFEDLYAELVSA